MSEAAGDDARDELRAAVRQCLQRHTDLRAYTGDPSEPGGEIDTELWHRLAGEIGVTGLVVPERCGGSAATLADLAVVFEEVGAALAPVPLLGTVGLALPALLANSGDAVADELMGRLAYGEATAALAISEPGGEYAPSATSVTATRSDAGWVLNGCKDFVVDLAAAGTILVPARAGSGLALFAVERHGSGVTVAGRQTLDLLRGMARLDLRDAAARMVGTESGAQWRLEAALNLGMVLLAAEQVGGAQRCLDNAVSYAKTRVQFDRPIGSFQAIKHQLVDLLLEVELARSAMTHALAMADEYLMDPADATARDLAEAASLSRSLCSQTYSHVADEALHIHGGIGFTWEHDSHLYYRRAKSAELLFGNPDQHRDRLATMAGL